mmetsp:Transcript_27448/g.50020  ORF Transcript_27448/g.50020 Transcript_27448/m.50020 type:complete len:105 (+) Transcript_27448:77-391(+)
MQAMTCPLAPATHRTQSSMLPARAQARPPLSQQELPDENSEADHEHRIHDSVYSNPIVAQHPPSSEAYPAVGKEPTQSSSDTDLRPAVIATHNTKRANDHSCEK